MNNDRLFVGAVLDTSDVRLSTFKHWKRVIADFEENLRQRGIKEYFAVVGDLTRYRFARFLGFESNYEVYNNQYEVVRKELF